MRVFVRRLMNDPIEDAQFSIMVRDINREQNMLYLRTNVPQGHVYIVNEQTTDEQHVYVPGFNMGFPRILLDEFPLRFRQIVDVLVMRAAEERSRVYEQPKAVKAVLVNHGRQYFITPKLLKGKKCENNCSICLEPLLPEGKRRKKVWELECGDSFCVGCIRKWFKEDSRCPNCRKDCAE